MHKYRIVLAALLLLFILALPRATGDWSYPDVLRHVSMTLKGEAPYSDIAQDFYGFHALVTKQDPYAILGPALKTIGVEWNVGHPSTHPPTAYLLVAPVALLRWPLSSAVWAWLMFVCLCISLRIGGGYSWDLSFLLAVLALYWPPIATSLGQMTLIWLIGLMLAYRVRNTRPFWSGVFIGVASFTKFLPGVLLIPFILRREWKAVTGFLISWIAACGVIFMLSPNALMRFLQVSRNETIHTIMRLDNGAFTMFLYNRMGTPGFLIAAIAFVLLLALARRVWCRSRDESISQEEWDLYSFIAVVLLPIAWIYSLAPLFPQLLHMMRSRRTIARALAASAIVLPMVVAPWGESTPIGLFAFSLLSGIAIVLAVPDRVSRP